MSSKSVVFWDVDTQRDFMRPEGKLYVPKAEKIIPNLKRLVDAARKGRVLLVSSACAHVPDDEEFKDFPPHCMVGTRGQKKIPETLTRRPYIVSNKPNARLPKRFKPGQQIVIEKRKLDVFSNPNIERVLARIRKSARPREFVVFGVVTEYCVRCAALGLLKRGERVAIVTDTIETLKPSEGKKTLAGLKARGARLISTEEALALVTGMGKPLQAGRGRWYHSRQRRS
jgi:nicotinamidase/pyrazinamidase